MSKKKIKKKKKTKKKKNQKRTEFERKRIPVFMSLLLQAMDLRSERNLKGHSPFKSRAW